MVDQPVHRVFATPIEPATDANAADHPTAPPPNPLRITGLAAGFMMSKLLFVGVEVGLFAALSTEGATAQTIAERCQLPLRSARALADLLAAGGLVERDGDRYRNAPDSEAFLAGRGPLDLRAMMRYWDTVMYPTWNRAAEGFRTRQGVQVPLTDAETLAYESAVALVTAEAAADLARAYDFGPHQRLLDVGGGLGTFSKPILAAFPQLTATLLDLPQVVDGAKEHLCAGPAAERLDAVGVDVFTEPLPDGHDAIIVANFLHLFSPERNIELLARLREVVAPGGRLLLVDWWRDGPPHPSARLAAGVFLMISGGDTYTADEVAQWLTETGWRFVASQALPPPAGLIIAEPAEG